MKRDPGVFLSHILQSIELIESYTKGIDKASFEQSVGVQDQVMRRLEIIGEAVKKLPADIKNGHPDVPWKQIAGMRDILIHEYFGVDVKLAWQVVQRDLLPLKKKVKEILGQLSEPRLFGNNT
jgi:uncharacterized protein with HEPN domain